MSESLAILSESVQRELMVEQLKVIFRKEKQIPNSVSYDMRRFVKQAGWQPDDIGLMEYTYISENNPENSLKLKFCVAGQAYCEEDECDDGSACKKTGLSNCSDTIETVDVYSFSFTFSYLRQFLSTKAAISEAEKYLGFEHTQSINHLIPLC